METPQVLLDHHLKALRLPTFLREYDKVAQQCDEEAVDYPHYLFRLSELELLDRERRATERRIKQARFPVVKSLGSFDFLAIPSLNKLLVLELMRGEFIDWRECVLAPWATPVRAKRTLPCQLVWRLASKAIVCGLQRLPRRCAT
jgi:DNA replication protein DnaC